MYHKGIKQKLIETFSNSSHNKNNSNSYHKCLRQGKVPWRLHWSAEYHIHITTVTITNITPISRKEGNDALHET